MLDNTNTKVQLEGKVRIPSGCAISGIFAQDGELFSGRDIITSIAVMHDRSNGLGGGFAGYGIYPKHKDKYAIHMFYDSEDDRGKAERRINKYFSYVLSEQIPTQKHPNIKDAPLIYRYFAEPLTEQLEKAQIDEREYVARFALRVNADEDELKGAHVISCGKNMGIFKANGFPEDVGEFYKLDEYKGYCWTAHGRYPTNTPGWWGGAHPFGLLDYSVVHNGEISSYDANRRYLEMFGYTCSLQTDTEAITYIVDYLNRKQGLELEDVAKVMAAPFWSTIERMDEKEKAAYTFLRRRYGNLLVTGPFSIMLGFTGGLMVLGDRLKLRSMVCGHQQNKFYAASEECAIRAICPEIQGIHSPRSGEAVIVRLEENK
ncbi:MAG: hypothetical protein LBR73_05095 [Oscillospiraceae bacterium]|jgi:glutamate synthase domain-containing protein 1|nr:hypothetical protein [Oscillospiraceae bacterium]